MAGYIWYTHAHLVRTPQHSKEDEMKYLWTGCMALFFASLGWVLWSKFGSTLPEKVFGEVVIGIFGAGFCSYIFMELDY